jgi:hypothetical protein
MPLHTVRLSVRRLACTYLSPPDAGVVRSYPNFTSRLHFFADEFDQSKWRDMVTRAAGGAHGGEVQATL